MAIVSILSSFVFIRCGSLCLCLCVCAYTMAKTNTINSRYSIKKHDVHLHTVHMNAHFKTLQNLSFYRLLLLSPSLTPTLMHIQYTHTLLFSNPLYLFVTELQFKPLYFFLFFFHYYFYLQNSMAQIYFRWISMCVCVFTYTYIWCGVMPTYVK